MPSGIPVLGQIPWGSHLCQFYRSESDLLDVLVPFFVAGLQNREKCLWIAGPRLPAAAAREAMVRAWPDAQRCIESAQLLIIDQCDWYASGDAADMSAAIHTLFEREAAACQEGYRGLRVTGDASSLKRDGWAELCRYEAEVHREFRDCNVVGICSYALTDCSASDVIDIMHNHQLALLHHENSVRKTRSATATLSLLDASLLAGTVPARSTHHSVHFFDAAAYPSAQIAAFLAAALERGGGALAIATKDHLASIGRELSKYGVHPSSERTAHLRLVDVGEILPDLMGPSGPDPMRFRTVIDHLLLSLDAAPEKIHAYGEIVDVLVAEGRVDDALHLEKLWDEVLERTRCKLNCAYTLQNFVKHGEEHRIHDVSASHTSIQPATRDHHVEEAASTEHRLMAERDLYRWVVQHQRGRRRTAHPDLWEAEPLDASLQAMTSALLDADSVSDVVHAIRIEVSEALHADHVALALAREGSSELRLVDPASLSTAAAQLYGGSRLAPALPLAHAFQSAQAVLLESTRAIERDFPLLARIFSSVAAIPLSTRRTRVGALEFGFAEARSFSSAQRAFLQDAAKLIATALERIQLSEALREANRRKDKVFSLLRHQLRNPLAPIMTALELLRLRGIDAVETERSIIERHAQHLSHLVDDLVDMASSEQGKVQLLTKRVELSSVLVRAIEIAAPLIEERSHQLTVEAPTTGMQIDVDPTRFARVISNLLLNAAKYAERPGRILLRCSKLDGVVEIEVHDTGIGIPADMLGSIFGPFVQLHASGLPAQARGLGLGLAMVKTLTELHGGSVHAASPGPGRGSTFTVRIPAARD